MGVRCFLLEPTNTVRRSYRRYAGVSLNECRGRSYHNAMVPFDQVPAEWREDQNGRLLTNLYSPDDFHPSWFPEACECGYAFKEADQRQIFVELLYRRRDTGDVTTLRDAGPGAMWDAWWMPAHYRGADGLCLVVKLPNGNEWMIDSRASNCTLPNDHVHKCWIRHGLPPNLTVDKNGQTCAAGAGSIQSGDYHGFLRDGVLTP